MSKTVNGKGIDILEEEGIISPEEHDKMAMDDGNDPDIRVAHIEEPDGIENLMSILDGVLGEDKSPKEIAMYKFIQDLSVCRSNVETLSEMVDRDEVVNVLTNILDVVEKGAKTEGVPELRVCMTLLAFVDSFMAHPEETLDGVMGVLLKLQNK